MAKWSPPEFTYHRYPDGTLVAVGSDGKPLDCQPQLTTQTATIADPAGDGSVPPRTASVVVDQWGNRVDEYEIPPYTVVHQNINVVPGNWDVVAVAVDADGNPVPFVPTMEVVGMGPNDSSVVKMADGSTANVDLYDGPRDFFIHVAASHTRLEGGVPEYEAIAVDASGVPLPVQPLFMYDDVQLDPDGIPYGGPVFWGKPPAFLPPPYEFPEFSVHLDYPPGALGHTNAAPTPIAVGADGKPLAIQPNWQIDPADHTNVVAVMPDGQLRDAERYEFPKYRVQIEYPADSYRGAAVPVPHPIAVDDNGVPLPIQPELTVDPTDHSRVTATYGDYTTQPVEVQEPPKDFYVHVESSGGLGGARGGVTYGAIAVDADGQPLPIQPHLVVDPTDPTKVTAYFPDGTTSVPTPLYPPPGEPPDDWPPDEWPPTSDKDDEDDEDDEAADGKAESDDDTIGLPDDAAAEPDPTATPPDDVEAAEPGYVTVEGRDPGAEPDPTATPPHDVEAVAPEMEQTSAPLGETFDPSDRYSGVEMAEGEVVLDDDLNEPGAGEDLLTAGLDEPTTAEARAEAPEQIADDTTALADVSEIERLVTAGLEPEFKVEDAAFKVEEPVLDDAAPELKSGTEEAELKWFEPIEVATTNPVPLPAPEPVVTEVHEGPLEPIEMTEIPPPEPLEEAVIEPIEIVVEPLETAPIREVTPIGEPEERDRLASEDDDEEEEEPVQP